jgi:hypothetical protein
LTSAYFCNHICELEMSGKKAVVAGRQVDGLIDGRADRETDR